jgi:signal peptidase I
MIKPARYIIMIMLLSVISCKAYYIPTGAMEDTLHVGDHIYVKLLFDYKPERGDLVIFRPPHEDTKDYIKRVVAVPGDTFSIKENSVFINGKKIIEAYAKGITRKFEFFNETKVDIYDKIVPPGKVIVLGDNRENSQDSRFFGYVDRASVKGKAFLLYWNTQEIRNLDFSRIGFIR